METKMTENGGNSLPLYRVDKFIVPANGRDEFLERVGATHKLLRTQDGFVRDAILEQQTGPEESRIITVVEWARSDVVETVSQKVAEMHRSVGFDRLEMMARLGIQADIGNYRRLDI